MSELGLGFEEERVKKRKKKKQLKLNSSSQDIGEVLMQEEEEQVVIDKTLDSEQEETAGPPTEKFGNQRVNSEMHPLAVNKLGYPRTASLDLNCHNTAILSPQFFVGGITGLKKSSWTPNYQKGWSSERVPLPANNRQRYLCKALPSKWEDAGRWIGSPVSMDAAGRLVPPSYYRRPKSKSGPLGAHSPLVQCFDSGRVVNVAASSPFLAGVLVANRQCYGSARGGAEGCVDGSFVSANVESYMVQQSASMHGWSDLSSQDEKLDSKEGSIIVSPKVLQKDVSTQMSPVGSIHSSPDKRSLYSVPPSADPIAKREDHFSKLEIRDVQIDDQSTVTRRPKKHVSSDRCLRNIIEWKNKTLGNKSSAWEVEEPSKFLSKYNREEAKIGAWRKLQEAKAEKAIRKLEKLEKERSSSMDKIINNLKSAQKKAEDMQNAVRASQAHRTERASRRASFFTRSIRLSFLCCCFTCPASLFWGCFT